MPLQEASSRPRASSLLPPETKEQINENVSLFTLDQLSRYLDRSNPAQPRQTTPIQIDGTNYYIPDHNTLALAGITRSNAVFYSNWRYDGNTPPAVSDGRIVMADRAFTPIEGGKLQQPRRERVITYSDGAKHVSTSLLFRHDTLAAVAGRPVRSDHQAVYRFTPVFFTGVGSNIKDPYMCYIEATAVYLGRYFVGDIKEFIPQSFWDDQQNTAIRSYAGSSSQVRMKRVILKPRSVGYVLLTGRLIPRTSVQTAAGAMSRLPVSGAMGSTVMRNIALLRKLLSGVLASCIPIRSPIRATSTKGSVKP